MREGWRFTYDAAAPSTFHRACIRRGVEVVLAKACFETFPAGIGHPGGGSRPARPKRHELRMARPALSKAGNRSEGTDPNQSDGESYSGTNEVPDLENWEDSKEKIQTAKEAVQALRNYIAKKDEVKWSEAEREAVRKKAAEERERIMRSQTDLTKLREQLDALFSRIGTQQGGYEFQDWFYKLMDFSEINNRRPFILRVITIFDNGVTKIIDGRHH